MYRFVILPRQINQVVYIKSLGIIVFYRDNMVYDLACFDTLVLVPCIDIHVTVTLFNLAA